MIIIEDDAASESSASESKRSFRASAAEEAESSILIAPPPYNDTLPLPLSIPLQPRRQRGTFRRFCKALAIAVLIYVCLGMIVARTIKARAQPPRTKWPRPPPQPSIPKWDGTALRCHEFHEGPGLSGTAFSPSLPPLSPSETLRDLPYTPEIGLPRSRMPYTLPYHTDAYFHFPTNIPLFFVRSSSEIATGMVTIVQSNVSEQDITVAVGVKYSSTQAAEGVRLCAMSGPDGSQGLGIYTAEDGQTDATDSFLFDIRVELPANNSAAIPALEAMLKNFSHYIGPLNGPRMNISLRATNGRIRFQELIANDLKVETLNGGISGSCDVAGQLALATMNGPIELKIGTRGAKAKIQTENGNVAGDIVVTEQLDIITNNGAVDVRISLENTKDRDATQAFISTTNNHLSAEVSLATVDSHGTASEDGSFDVSARTKNGFLFLDFTEQPRSSTLFVDGHSINDGAAVLLSPSFEGNFTVESPPFHRPTVEYTSGYDEDKVRNIVPSVEANVVTGSVSWYKSVGPKRNGTVHVTTTRGENFLGL